MSLQPESVALALERLNVPLSRAEAHGILCGLLTASQTSVAKTRWFSELLDAAQMQAGDVSAKAGDLKILDTWFTEELDALNNADLEFLPAVPDDSAPIGARVQALGEFCAGFTYGLGLATANRGNKALPTDTRELIEDFQAIDGAEVHIGTGKSRQGGTSGTGESDNTDEDAYIELLEYVKVGVLLIHEEMKPVTPSNQEQLS